MDHLAKNGSGVELPTGVSCSPAEKYDRLLNLFVKNIAPMNRRTFLRDASACSTLALLGIPTAGGGNTIRNTGSRRLFFETAEIPRIIANATEGPMAPAFQRWKSESAGDALDDLNDAIASGDLLYAFGNAMTSLQEQALVYLVNQGAGRRAVLLSAIDTLVAMPVWDYMRDGGTRVLGLMRASRATSLILFMREVLAEHVPDDVQARILDAVAEKGCVPLDLTIRQMDDPSTVTGWGFELPQVDLYPYDMRRWPVILGHINLRAVPTMGLGLGALALEDHDPRSAEWLSRAESSALFFLGLFENDGSYSEGLSYVDYAFRTLFLFLEAHYRLKGTVDWIDRANFRGVTDFIVGLQAGRRADGDVPDIVNISDSRNSVAHCVPAWIARHSNDPLAQYASRHFSRSGYFADALWYDPDQPEVPPPDSLENVRFDNGWIVTRNGWGDDDPVVAFRGGGPQNHEHADRNSLFIKAFGERLLTEQEGASYDPRHERWLLRLPEAHNLLLIDGKGHQYVDGTEGTNSSDAHARTVRFVDRGDVVWWTSDATQAYQLSHDGVVRVVRSVLFAKPDLIVVFDSVSRPGIASRFSVRLFPDNRDGRAVIETRSDDSFHLGRPRAAIHGAYGGDVTLSQRTAQLPVSTESGRFPYMEIVSDPVESASILTALRIVPTGVEGEAGSEVLSVDHTDWTVTCGRRMIRVLGPYDVPAFTWEM
jgi:hypothetical protein